MVSKIEDILQGFKSQQSFQLENPNLKKNLFVLSEKTLTKN